MLLHALPFLASLAPFGRRIGVGLNKDNFEEGKKSGPRVEKLALHYLQSQQKFVGFCQHVLKPSHLRKNVEREGWTTDWTFPANRNHNGLGEREMPTIGHHMFNVETNRNHKTTVSADHESGNCTKLDACRSNVVKGQSTQLTEGCRQKFGIRQVDRTFALFLATRDKGWDNSQFSYGGLCTSALLKILTTSFCGRRGDDIRFSHYQVSSTMVQKMYGGQPRTISCTSR
ncbi:hypothetical protein EV421DRAFT_2019379, partial [Armillaria borealis]